MVWRVARASETLLAEVDARCPNRDTTSDGSIGDQSHAGRGSDSDHNPWIIDSNGYGVVRARDIDEDLDGNKADTGDDARWLAEHIRALGKAGDIRLANFGYVIYAGQIAGGNPLRGPGRWEWREYTGPNAHEHHVHVSLSRDAEGYDSTASWGIYPPAIPEGEGFLSALTEDEQREALEILRSLKTDYLTKGKEVRQVIVETRKGVQDLTSGKRPTKPK